MIAKIKKCLRLLTHTFCSLWHHRGQIVPDDLPDRHLYGLPDALYMSYQPWRSAEYDDLFTPEVMTNTMLSRSKLYIIMRFLEVSLGKTGDLLEAGAGNGGSARFIVNYLCRMKSRRCFWVLDTFAGYPEISPDMDGTHMRKGECAGKGEEYVRKLLDNPLVDARIVKGSVPRSLDSVKAETISFAHIDINLYEPTLAAASFCLERMPSGGVMVFDDYNWPATYGARIAVDEVARKYRQAIISIPGSTQAVILKR